jgi:hypothetical protein
VFLSEVEVTHFGRVSSRENVSFADAHLPAGHVRLLRNAGTSRTVLWLYKLIINCDAPLTCAMKWAQYAGRMLCGRPAKAARSRLAARGAWAFLSRGLVRFWRA